jgi:hypothetical protein
MKKVHKIVPSNQVKILFDIKLKEEAGSFCAVKFPRKISHIHVVVMDTPFFMTTLCTFETRNPCEAARHATIILVMNLAMT